MEKRGMRNKFPYLKQDLFTLGEARSLNHGSGSMGLVSRSIQKKINRLEKEYKNLEANQGDKNGRRFCMLDQRELVKVLTQIIDELPPQEKTLFSLYYCEELNFKEIGEVLRYSDLKVIRLFRDGLKKVAAKMHLKADN
jgi:RNA polymerase sigma factor (sigma-70 family)